MERTLLLNVVIRKSAAWHVSTHRIIGVTIFKLLSGEDKTLLVGRDALLVLDLGFDIVNGIRGLNFQGNRLTREGLDEDLHPATKTKDKMKRTFLLDIVIRQGTT